MTSVCQFSKQGKSQVSVKQHVAVAIQMSDLPHEALAELVPCQDQDALYHRVQARGLEGAQLQAEERGGHFAYESIEIRQPVKLKRSTDEVCRKLTFER